MHKIFELKGMELDQLQSLASELGIKGYKKMSKEDLVYGILDEEARKNAQNLPEKPAQKKRGRPKKSEVKSTDVVVEKDERVEKTSPKVQEPKAETEPAKPKITLSL